MLQLRSEIAPLSLKDLGDTQGRGTGLAVDFTYSVPAQGHGQRQLPYLVDSSHAQQGRHGL